MEEANNRRMAFKVISIAITVVGILLMAYMVTVESEPGLLPLLLVLTGTASYIYLRVKIVKKNS